MIKVTGTIMLRGWYAVQLDMTEEEFDALPHRRQNELIEDAVDWRGITESADVDDIEVDTLEEVE